jgi:transcriptional regulator with XRE-family HTH domain
MCRRHRSGYLNEDRLGRHRTDDTHFGQTDGVTISMTKIPNPTDKYVGSRVRMRRMMLGLSQEKLADGLGLTFQQIQKYEKGANRISASRLQAISQILDAPVHFFFEGGPQSAKGGQALGDSPSPAYVTDFLTTADGLALVKAYVRIKDASLRRSIVRMVQAITGESE